MPRLGRARNEGTRVGLKADNLIRQEAASVTGLTHRSLGVGIPGQKQTAGEPMNEFSLGWRSKKKVEPYATTGKETR